MRKETRRLIGARPITKFNVKGSVIFSITLPFAIQKSVERIPFETLEGDSFRLFLGYVLTVRAFGEKGNLRGKPPYGVRFPPT